MTVSSAHTVQQNPGWGLPQAVPILEVQKDNYRTKTFVLDAKLAAVPGQFVMVWLPRFDEKPFSLVDADPVTLMITAVGPFTRQVHEKRPGDRLWLRGPFGHGFEETGNGQTAALVGGGYGVAPLLWLAREKLALSARLLAVLGARTAQDLLYVDRFVRLQRKRAAGAGALEVIVCTEDGSQGVSGRVTDPLLPRLRAGSIGTIYACGPDAMLAALDRLGAEHHTPRQLSWEAYMRCGVGLCGSCEHQGKLLCLDGPVLASG